MKVRANATYRYRPVGMDIWSPKSAATADMIVQVTKLPGCPAPNVMGHCHIVSTTEFSMVRGKRTPRFLGLVLTASLSKP